MLLMITPNGAKLRDSQRGALCHAHRVPMRVLFRRASGHYKQEAQLRLLVVSRPGFCVFSFDEFREGLQLLLENE